MGYSGSVNIHIASNVYSGMLTREAWLWDIQKV